MTRLAAWGVFVALSLGAPSVGRAYELKRTEGGTTVRWLQAEVRLCVSPVDPRSGLDRPTVDQAARMAADAWSEVPGVPRIVVDEGPCGVAAALDGVNTISVLPEWGEGPQHLAVTRSTHLPRTGQLIEADVLINGAFPLQMLEDDGEEDTDYDLPTVLTHELGHLLGLGESREVEAVMWPLIGRGGVEGRELAPDDVDGVLALYGTSPTDAPLRAGCSVSSAPGRGGTGAFALGLAAALFILRRR